MERLAGDGALTCGNVMAFREVPRGAICVSGLLACRMAPSGAMWCQMVPRGPAGCGRPGTGGGRVRRARAARGPAAPGEGGLSPTSVIEVARAENRIRFGLSMRAGSEAEKASDRAALGVKELPGRIRKSASSPPVIRFSRRCPVWKGFG
ncbi:hypothetical protein GCM10010493_71890 [Streptomyces lavendulae subsp. grasserius]